MEIGVDEARAMTRRIVQGLVLIGLGAVLVAIGASVPARSAPQTIIEVELRKAVKTKKEGITSDEKTLRDVYCPKQKTPQAVEQCFKEYNETLDLVRQQVKDLESMIQAIIKYEADNEWTVNEMNAVIRRYYPKASTSPATDVKMKGTKPK